MITAYHIIFSTYGFWLPNDPRGSWSDFVGSWELFRYGPATRTSQRRSLAYEKHDHHHRLRAKAALKYPPVLFTGEQARAVARGFASYIHRKQLPVWACAILPDHVHLVTGRPGMKVEQLVIQLKGDATQQLQREGIHPLSQYTLPNKRIPHCWIRGEWKVYLDPEDIPRAIRYVQDNPIKESKPPQHWSFVTKYQQ
jgi:REP element-mobilizing transposase RayT